jgi:hypothetical protein
MICKSKRLRKEHLTEVVLPLIYATHLLRPKLKISSKFERAIATLKGPLKVPPKVQDRPVK